MKKVLIYSRTNTITGEILVIGEVIDDNVTVHAEWETFERSDLTASQTFTRLVRGNLELWIA